LAIYLYDIYRSPNIGVYLKASEKFLIAPRGLAPTKLTKLSKFLSVASIRSSISASRLLGVLIAMNDNGILVSRLADDDEVDEIKKATGLPVERLPSKFTSVGNIIAVNNKGAIVSTILNKKALQVIKDVLDVPVEQFQFSEYIQVGALITATDVGAVVYPNATEDEIEFISQILRVPTEPATVNGGVPFPSSGMIANSKAAVVGTLTTGPELAILSRALRV
jgi:translation initiation factor 6